MKRALRISPVTSSSIGAVGYDRRGGIFRVRFAGGGTYDYLGVPPALFAAFKMAESKGRFVNLVIKPNFPFERVS